MKNLIKKLEERQETALLNVDKGYGITIPESKQIITALKQNERLQDEVIKVLDENIELMNQESRRKNKDKTYKKGCDASVSVLVATKIKMGMMFDIVTNPTKI